MINSKEEYDLAYKERVEFWEALHENVHQQELLRLQERALRAMVHTIGEDMTAWEVANH